MGEKRFKVTIEDKVENKTFVFNYTNLDTESFRKMGIGDVTAFICHDTGMSDGLTALNKSIDRVNEAIKNLSEIHVSKKPIKE